MAILCFYACIKKCREWIGLSEAKPVDFTSAIDVRNDKFQGTFKRQC